MKLGVQELLIILVIVIIVIGPTQIPKLKRMFSKSRKNFEDEIRESEKEKDD